MRVDQNVILPLRHKVIFVNILSFQQKQVTFLFIYHEANIDLKWPLIIKLELRIY